MFRQIDVNNFSQHIRLNFESQCRNMRKDLAKYIDGIYNARGSVGKFQTFPPIMTKSGIGIGVNITAYLGKTDNKFYTIFQEYGTGLYMDPKWTPDKTDAIINANRTMSRNGKMISPRGKNSPWKDYGGGQHPGHNVIVFTIGGKTIVVPETKGVKPQKLLAKKIDSFLTVARLRNMIKPVIPFASKMSRRITI